MSKPPKTLHPVAAARRLRGITQDQLAHAAGVSQAAISKIERREVTHPNYLTRINIAEKLGFAAEELWPETEKGQRVPDELQAIIDSDNGRPRLRDHTHPAWADRVLSKAESLMASGDERKCRKFGQLLRPIAEEIDDGSDREELDLLWELIQELTRERVVRPAGQAKLAPKVPVPPARRTRTAPRARERKDSGSRASSSSADGESEPHRSGVRHAQHVRRR